MHMGFEVCQRQVKDMQAQCVSVCLVRRVSSAHMSTGRWWDWASTLFSGPVPNALREWAGSTCASAALSGPAGQMTSRPRTKDLCGCTCGSRRGCRQSRDAGGFGLHTFSDSLHASVAHSRHRVLPVPVGLSSKAFLPCARSVFQKQAL